MSILNNALSGAVAAQASLNMTSQNIANLQTRGYTRQGVLLAAITPGIGTQSAGSGVKVGALLRFADSYKTQQLWRSNAEYAKYDAQQPYLNQLEQVMGDDKSGLSNGVDNFFKALNALGSEPTSGPLRGQVITQAGAMAESFNSIYQVTRNQQLSVQQQREAALPDVNTLLANIASLNNRIATAGAQGTNTSGLIDQRDQAIDSLAGYAAIEVLEQPDGSRSVSLKSGQPLVIGGMAARLSTVPLADGGQELKIAFGNSSYKVDDSQMGGRLGGLGAFERNTLVPLQESIKQMAEQMATAFNEKLAGGVTSTGEAGKPLFELGGGGNGGVLSIAAGFTNDDLALGGADQEPPVAPGNSDNLQALIDIRNLKIDLPTIGSVSIADADTQLVGKLGVDSQQNKSLLATSTTIRQQAQDDWASTSGVNKDEEAINLVEFQAMYNANMKVIAVANTLFESTLAMFG